MRRASVTCWSMVAVFVLLGLSAPSVKAQQTKAKTAETTAKLELNTATEAELEKLPVDATIIGIVDSVNVENRTIFSARNAE